MNVVFLVFGIVAFCALVAYARAYEQQRLIPTRTLIARDNEANISDPSRKVS